MSLVLEMKKEEKRKKLLDAAYLLFLQKGAGHTTINDIAEEAKVAKGTFYLYFRDKESILQALIYRMSYRILAESYEKVNHTGDFGEEVVQLIDNVIEYFKRDSEVLRLLERNFSWPEVENQMEQKDNPLVMKLTQAVVNSPAMAGRSHDEILKLLFVIVEMCGSVCYSSIIEGRPDTIDNMKPVLYDIIRKSLAPR